jgi:hypothetical protein
MNPTGPLLGEDESLTHQVTETFAIVATGDPSWTEKVCAMAAAIDGSIQLGFGLGKYVNRNVMDGYAAVSRGVAQHTVRASRRLSPEPAVTAVGPIRYEVLEPLRAVRFVLEPNDCQPISFDCRFEAIVPPVLEERTHRLDRYRVQSDLLRYHQAGVASGWVEVDGERTEIDPGTWVSTRDHSWGTRTDVGLPEPGREPRSSLDSVPGVLYRMIWCPVAMRRPDGSRYALHLHYQITTAPGFVRKEVIGGVEHPDGTVEPWADLEPELRFDPDNRRLLGGTIVATTTAGIRHDLEVEVVSDTGVQLGAGLYFGLDGHHHGEWRGKLHVDGEHIEDCSTPEAARRLHQLRDTVVHVVDPVGGGEGWGNCQPIVSGGSEELGLDEATSFI